MNFELNAIERSCTRTSGGLKTLVLIDPADLTEQPAWHLSPNIADISFAPGKAAYVFQHKRFTARLEDDTPTDAAGDYFTYRLTAFIRVIRGEVELLRAKLINRRIHVVVTYMNGEQRFLPYLRLTGKGDSGATYGKDAPGVNFTGVMRLLKPAPFVAGTFDVIGGPYVPPESGGTGTVTLVELSTEDGTFSYTVPTGKWISGLEIRSTDAQTIKVGTTAGGEELSGMPVALDALTPFVLNGAILDTFSAHTIYFSDLAGTNSIRIWLLG